MKKKVAVLGASSNPERYANKAIKMLLSHGYDVIPVSLKEEVIEGIPAVKELSQIPDQLHAITIYLNPRHLLKLKEQIISAKPNNAIFNPGAESKELSEAFIEAGIKCENACTLVLLSTGQFPN